MQLRIRQLDICPPLHR